MMNHATTGIITAGFVGMLLAGSAATAPDGVFAAETAAPHRTIEVQGSSTVSAAPDRVRVTIAAVVRADTAAKAAEGNAATLSRLMEAMKGRVGDQGKVTTGQYSLNAEYDYVQEGRERRRVLKGYMASTDVQIVTRDLKSAGALIDLAASTGADEIRGVNFYLHDSVGARRQALLEAGHQASEEAATVAESLGVELGEVLQASTSSSPGRPAPMPYARMSADASMAKTELAPGDVEITASVNVVYAIR